LKESPIIYRILASAFRRAIGIKSASMVRQTMGFLLKELFAWLTER
jgi:hypothetical protein